MRRREFMALVGGTVAWPVAARAQQLATVGFLAVGEPPAILVEAFRRGVNEAGYGRNVTIEKYRSCLQIPRMNLKVPSQN